MKTLLTIIIAQLAITIANAQTEEPTTPAAAAECGQLKEQHFYNAERITAEDEFPWIGLLKQSKREELQGVYIGLTVLISRRYTLANAQRLREADDYEDISVVLGAWDKTIFWYTRAQHAEYKIDGVTIHPNFASDASNPNVFHNDLAVIRLRTAVAFNAHIAPICLPSAADVALSQNYVAHTLPYTGFPALLSDGLKKVKVLGRVMGASSCGRVQRINRTAGLVCAFSSDKLVPLGVGSALMGVSVEGGEPHHYHLIGLLSLSGVQTPYFNADILVRIENYLEWIEFNMY